MIGKVQSPRKPKNWNAYTSAINYGQAGEDVFDNEPIGNILAYLVLKSFKISY